MGQYFIPVNVTKGEYIHAHDFGDGLKLGEWYTCESRTHDALKALQATRWAGDEVVIAGDYDHEKIYCEARENYRNVSDLAKLILEKVQLNQQEARKMESK